jgi:hypothetical protein
MRKLLVFSLICMLSGLVLMACQHQQGVEASREEGQQGRTDTYPPRPAPTEEITPGPAGAQEMKGELTRVDWNNKTIVIRAANGMEQTFKFDDQTTVQWPETQPNRNQSKTEKQGTNANPVRALMAKEGSEVTVNWKDENGSKMATSINVTELGTKSGAKANTKSKTKGTY